MRSAARSENQRWQLWHAALAAAGHRDVQGGLLLAAAGRHPRRGCRRPWKPSVRRVLRPLTGWMIGIGAYYLLIGLTAVSVTGFLRDNPALADEAAQAGFRRAGQHRRIHRHPVRYCRHFRPGFTTVRMTAFLAAETDCRLTLLASQPVARIRLLAAEIAVTAVALVTGAGLLTWAGVTVTDGELAATAALRGAGNVLPIVLISLGAAVFAAGWAPRWADRANDRCTRSSLF